MSRSPDSHSNPACQVRVSMVPTSAQTSTGSDHDDEPSVENMSDRLSSTATAARRPLGAWWSVIQAMEPSKAGGAEAVSHGLSHSAQRATLADDDSA